MGHTKPGYGPSVPIDMRGMSDGRPTKRMALSPRIPAPRIVSNSAETVAGSPATGGRPNTRTRAQYLDAPNKRRRYGKRNTNATRKHGGDSIWFRDREGWGQDDTLRVTALTPARTQGTRYDASRATQQRTTAEHEGYRQRAMQDHSVMVTLGAVTPEPAWSDEPTDNDETES